MFGKYNRKKTFWWSPKNRFGFHSSVENVGDILGPNLIDKILTHKGSHIGTIQRNKRLLSVGSILHFARNGDVVWGSGVNGKVSRDLLKFDALDVRAVRGPKTAEILREMGEVVPSVYGDPGVLVSDFWPRCMDPIKGLVTYVPHFRETVPNTLIEQANVLYPMESVEEFLRKIQMSSKVITTSLHGYIIAESYGIPAVLIRNSSGETNFKYDDYFMGTGRSEALYVDNIEEAMDVEGVQFNLKHVKSRLLDSFPYDLFSG